jgi:hypothetical protein
MTIAMPSSVKSPLTKFGIRPRSAVFLVRLSFFFSPIMSLGFTEIGQGYCIQNTAPEDVGGFQRIAILAYS